MADPKYIFFAGYKVPIEVDAAVISYRDPKALQFYLTELIADPAAVEKGLVLQSLQYRGTEFEDDEEGQRWKPLFEAALKKRDEEAAKKKAEEDALKAAQAAAAGAPADGEATPPPDAPPPEEPPPAPKERLVTFNYRLGSDDTQNQVGRRLTRLPFNSPAIPGFDGGEGHIKDFRALQNILFQVILHHDGALNSIEGYNALVAKRMSAHFLIDFDGTIHQTLDTYHMGVMVGRNDNHAIHVVLNNPALPERGFGLDPPRTAFRRVINGQPRIGLSYTDAQYLSLIGLLRAMITPITAKSGKQWLAAPILARKCFPPSDQKNGRVLDDALTQTAHESFVGFMGHYHCNPTKWDPGPGFDWGRVTEGLHGSRSTLPVRLPGTDAIVFKSGIDQTKTFNAYHEHVEAGANGGWYPIGINQTWHSGVHLRSPQGRAVVSMFKGSIIAARNAARAFRGSPSFVLMRHELPPLPNPGGDPIPRPFYSLIMHLQHYSVVRRNNLNNFKKIGWIDALLSGDFSTPKGLPRDMHADTPFAREHLPPTVFDARKLEDDEAKLNARIAFSEGKVLLCDIPVRAGDPVGFSDFFGVDLDSSEPMIHIEVFSVDNLFPNANEKGREWYLVEGDLDDDSLASVTLPMREISRGLRLSNRTLSANEIVFKRSEIQDFFNSSATLSVKQRFRRMITYHISEWSSVTDWTRTADSAVGWQWQTQEAFSDWLWHWVPFRWLTPQVAEALTLPADHKFYYYNPIHFVQFVNSNYTGKVTRKQQLSKAEELKLEYEQLERKGEGRTSLESKRMQEIARQLEGAKPKPGSRASSITDATTWDAAEWPPP